MAARAPLRLVKPEKVGVDDYLEKHSIEELNTLPDTQAQPPENLTDVGNARRFVRQHGTVARYCPSLGWLVWDGGRWRGDDSGEVMRHAKAAAQFIYIEAANEPDDTRREKLGKWAAQSESEHRLKAMIELAKSEPGVVVRVEELDRNPWLLGVTNGVIDLKTGKRRDATPADLITKQASVPFDARARCPRWDKFVLEIMGGNARLVQFLQRAVGYSLTGDTREQCLFLLHGTGSNGKSTFLTVLKKLMGDYAMQCNPETLMVKRNGGGIPNDIARLRGARFVPTSETEEDRRLAESLVKQITGGDTIAARFLFGEYFEFVPTFKVFLAANHKPVIRGDDYAIWRRIRLVPFNVTFPLDGTLADKLLAELPGILNWAIKGCLTWQRDGLRPPPEVTKATGAYRAEMDALRTWIEERCIEANTAHGLSAQLYQSYRQWAEASGERVMSQRVFARRLEERGFKRKRTNQGVVYVGIGVQGVRP